jgi:FKBP-type peptidyl-prolyl cis-trans isomerase FkpA
MRPGFQLLLIGLIATACGDARPREDTAPPPGTAEDAALNTSQVTDSYAPALNVDLAQMTRAESGLHTRDLVVGEGDEAGPGSTVTVHYTGWLPDGTQFDTSVGSNPFTFLLGDGEVIEGWDQGLVGMRQGGTRRLVIPPSLAYGARGAGGVIPPGATLVFDVELLEVR